jgi:hypothetical protein
MPTVSAKVLQTQITELEVALAAAIEAKRVADLAAPWQAQLTLTDSALLTANTVVANATSQGAATSAASNALVCVCKV